MINRYVMLLLLPAGYMTNFHLTDALPLPQVLGGLIDDPLGITSGVVNIVTAAKSNVNDCSNSGTNFGSGSLFGGGMVGGILNGVANIVQAGKMKEAKAQGVSCPGRQSGIVGTNNINPVGMILNTVANGMNLASDFNDPTGIDKLTMDDRNRDVFAPRF